MINFRHQDNQSGTTLIKLIVIIVVIVLGILSVYTAFRFVSVAFFESPGFYQETVRAARYAHRLAVHRGDKVRIQFSSKGYKLFYRDNPGSYKSLPEHSHPVSSNSRDDITLTSEDVYLPTNATFDALGRCQDCCQDCNGTLTIFVEGQKMTIYKETGFVNATL